MVPSRSRPSRACGLKLLPPAAGVGWQGSRPSRACGLKPVGSSSTRVEPSSRPLRACGLKPPYRHDRGRYCRSRPSRACGLKRDSVARRIRADHVTPFSRVWIETAREGSLPSTGWSRPSRACGLERPGPGEDMTSSESRPSRACGLKPRVERRDSRDVGHALRGRVD